MQALLADFTSYFLATIETIIVSFCITLFFYGNANAIFDIFLNRS
jgi:hypothetical protein